MVGSSVLGRGVIVNRGDAPPVGWENSRRVCIDGATVADPGSAVAQLHDAWIRREPVVVELCVDSRIFREPTSIRCEPWTLPYSTEMWTDRLQFLIWANNYDARSGECFWSWGQRAAVLGATQTPDGPADVMLSDGTAAWIDGGPRSTCDPQRVDNPIVHFETVEAGSLELARTPSDVGAQLAADQLAAVAHIGGPARILAPAGSGKTRVLTERLRYLIKDRGYASGNVVAIAYNKKAQLEIEQRCSDFSPRVMTLNALGYSVLTRALGRRPRVVEDRDVRAILRDLAPKKRQRANTDPLRPYIEALSLIRLGLRDPQEVEASRADVPGIAAMVFDPFRVHLIAIGAVDFDEQIYRAIEMLLSDGALRRELQQEFKHFLIDEFQDLTPAHVLLIRLLASPELDVFGVGDDDQVIYGHAGADPAFLLDFDQLFPCSSQFQLQINYRCPATVIDHARTLLSYNRRRVVKQITPRPDVNDNNDAYAVEICAPDRGAATTVECIARWIDVGIATEDIAVLARVNSLLLAPHIALAEAGIPLMSVLGPEVLQRTGLRAALSYLRIGAAPEGFSPTDVEEVYRRPSRGLPPWFTKWLRGRMTTDDLRGVAHKIEDPKVGEKVVALADELDLVIAATQSGTTRDVVRVIKDDIGLGTAMGMLDATGATQGGSSHLDDLDALDQVAALHPNPTTFDSWLRTTLHRERAAGGVTLSTVHRVKGMEWDNVVVYGITAGISPHRLAVDIEEERRILHVGITRCRKRVVIVGDKTRQSPFFAELDGTAPHHTEAPTQPSPAANPPILAAKPAKKTILVVELDGPATLRFDALKKWRLDRARRDKVPAYVVFKNTDLEAIASAAPASLADLGRCSGVGPARLDLYGDQILAVIASNEFVLPTATVQSAPPKAPAVTDNRWNNLDPETEIVFENLKQWRLERSTRDDIADHLIMTKTYLLGIAKARPGSLRALQACPGVGPKKMALYADEILQVIAES